MDAWLKDLVRKSIVYHKLVSSRTFEVIILLRKFFLVGGLLASLSACSLEASLQSQSIDVEFLNRKEPDLIHGELVTTSAGHQMTGVFGEISEATKSFNNSQWEFESVFYE